MLKIQKIIHIQIQLDELYLMIYKTKKLFFYATLLHLVHLTKKTKCVQNIIGRGRKRKTTGYLDRAIQQKIKADRRQSASSVKVVIETEFGIIISEETVRRRLHEVGFKHRVARKKPYFDKTNQMKRIQYAKKYREQPLCFWNQVLWTDENKFNCLALTKWLWFGEHRRKHSIPDARLPPLTPRRKCKVLGLYLIIRCGKSCFYRREHDRRGLS